MTEKKQKMKPLRVFPLKPKKDSDKTKLNKSSFRVSKCFISFIFLNFKVLFFLLSLSGKNRDMQIFSFQQTNRTKSRNEGSVLHTGSHRTRKKTPLRSEQIQNALRRSGFLTHVPSSSRGRVSRCIKS